MKIKTKISYNCLEAICDLYDVVTETHAVNPQEYHTKKDYRASLDIIDLLFEKLKVKLIKKKKGCNPFSLDYQYHQAFFLMTFLRANIHYFTHEYYQTIIYLYATEIDQQL